MIPMGLFEVHGYRCYNGTPNGRTVNVILEGCFPLLQAEYAATTVARALRGKSVTLECIRGTSLYCCKINDVPVKELIKWQE